MNLLSARVLLMSSSRSMPCFRYSSQEKRKLWLATANDDKKRGAVNNDMEPVSGKRVTWRSVKSEIQERRQQVPLGETGGTSGIIEGLCRCDKYCGHHHPRGALASWDVGPGSSHAVPVCSVTACLLKRVLTAWKDYFQYLPVSFKGRKTGLIIVSD